ncbi:MAG: sigma factor [Kofleriaceae bacterium]
MAVIDDVIRRERGRIVGAVMRVTHDLDAAEDALQEATVALLNASEMPANPAAWLTTAARRVALDGKRHDRVREAKAPRITVDPIEAIDPDAIADDYLRLLFTCCHPVLGRDNQIALTLKVVAGFSTGDIARAFVVSEDTISQRILRAKRMLKDQVIEIEDVSARVDAVLGVVYAIANEGHGGRSELVMDALRLARLICELAPEEPNAFALVAIVAFIAARAETRDALLEHQDRSRWDRRLIREGLNRVADGACGSNVVCRAGRARGDACDVELGGHGLAGDRRAL